MELRPLGRTGVLVSALCPGAMMFGERGTTDHDECIGIIHRALDAGVNFVDTADVHSAGESEQIVGKAIAGRRDEIVLATKVHTPMGDDPNRRGNSRRWIIAEVGRSLRRLGEPRARRDRAAPLNRAPRTTPTPWTTPTTPTTPKGLLPWSSPRSRPPRRAQPRRSPVTSGSTRSPEDSLPRH